MSDTWTPEQREAILHCGTDICVAAGAGSGKTGVLVERFLRIITASRDETLPQEERAGIDQILVITFTEKATREMKTRIVEALNRLGLTEERRQVESAYISTIHGFCSRLLQENPFEAGVDPAFQVLDEPQARRLLRQTVEEVVAEAYRQDDREIIELVAAAQAARGFGEDLGDPLAPLAGAVEMTLGRMRGAGVDLDTLERLWQQGCTATTARSLDPVRAILAPILQELHAAVEALTSLRASLLGSVQTAATGLAELAGSLNPESAPIEVIGVLEEIGKQSAKVRSRPNASEAESLAIQLFFRVKTACEGARALYGTTAAREEEAARLCHRLWRLVIAVWKAYDTARLRRGRLDNDALQAEAVRLLENSPAVRARYRRRFRHLMVDEFQDTNPLQMRLVNALRVTEREARRDGETHRARGLSAAEVAALTISRNFLFVVGDVQQSIYAFRNADASLFRALERRFRENREGKHIALAVNFRSRPELLSLISTVFRQIWRDETTPFVPLAPGARFHNRSQPCIELLLARDLMRRDYVALEAQALAVRLRALVEDREMRLTSLSDRRCGELVAYRDIAVLLRSLTDIQLYEEAFARHGVPYFVVGGGRGYYARTEIRDILNVLTVLDSPMNDVALAAVLRSPFAGVEVETLFLMAQEAKAEPGPEDRAQRGDSSRKQRRGRAPLYLALRRLLSEGRLPSQEQERIAPLIQTLEELQAKEDRLPVGHLLERLLARTRYDVRLLCRPGGRRRLANVRKLLQMANSDSVTGVRDFIRRLRDLEKLSDREGDAPTEEEAADVVRFHSIHSAKGLEFPVVVLADLSRPLLVPERGLFVCDPHHLALGTKLGGEPGLTYRAIEKRRLEADRQEYARLLYVAITRAREHLILCANTGRSRGFNWAENLLPLLGVLEPPPEPCTQLLPGGIPAHVSPLRWFS